MEMTRPSITEQISDFELWIWTLSIGILDMAKLEHEDALPENNTALSAV